MRGNSLRAARMRVARMQVRAVRVRATRSMRVVETWTLRGRYITCTEDFAMLLASDMRTGSLLLCNSHRQFGLWLGAADDSGLHWCLNHQQSGMVQQPSAVCLVDWRRGQE